MVSYIKAETRTHVGRPLRSQASSQKYFRFCPSLCYWRPPEVLGFFFKVFIFLNSVLLCFTCILHGYALVKKQQKCLQITAASHSSPLVADEQQTQHAPIHTHTQIPAHTYTAHYWHTLFSSCTDIHTHTYTQGMMSERAVACTAVNGVSQREIRLFNKLWAWGGKKRVCVCLFVYFRWFTGHAVAIINTKCHPGSYRVQVNKLQYFQVFLLKFLRFNCLGATVEMTANHSKF